MNSVFIYFLEQSVHIGAIWDTNDSGLSYTSLMYKKYEEG